MTATPTAKVALRGPDGDVETLWAIDLGDNRYRLENTPWYAYGISWQDTVEALPDDDGQLQFKRVVEKSGHRTVRIQAEVPFSDEWLSRLVELGVTYEGANRRFIGVDIPPEIELSEVANFLTREDIEWEYADPPYEEVHGETAAT